MMTFTHDDIRERLVDFLYGELDAGARAAFDAHLVECAGCRGEVARAEQARAIGRAVARAPLGDAVPPGVRVRVLAAAYAAGNAKAVPAGESPAVRQPPSGNEAARAPRWLDRLRRPWAVPVLSTFATAAALAVFLFARGTIVQQAQRPLGERTLDGLAAKEPAAPAPPLVPPSSLSGLDEQAHAPKRRGLARPAPVVDPPATSRSAAEPVAAAAPLAGAATASPPDPLATLVERGEAAMAAHRWNQAAAIYHQLLRRYPEDAAAQVWHRKLAAARAAIAAESGRFAAPPPSR